MREALRVGGREGREGGREGGRDRYEVTQSRKGVYTERGRETGREGEI